MKTAWNSTTLAESSETRIVEGNHYFPPDSVNREYFSDSQTTTMCPWKGDASYYTLDVDGATNVDAAWYYPTPKDAAVEIKGYIAFWHGVEVTE